MLSRSVGLVSTCALGASAFLIPASLLPTHEDHAVAWSDPLLASTQTTWFARLPCAECAFPTPKSSLKELAEETFTIQGGSYDLLLNFTLSHDGSKLEVGGNTIYPPRSFLKSWFASPSTSVEVYQIPSSLSLDDANFNLIKTMPLKVTESTMRTMTRPGDNWDEKKAKIIYQINSVEGQKMDLDVVKVKLSRKAGGPLSVVSINKRPHISAGRLPGGFSAHHRPEQHSCDYLPGPLCKLVSPKPKKPCGGMGKGRQGLAFARPHSHHQDHGLPGMHHGSHSDDVTPGEKPFHPHHQHHHSLTSGQDMMGAFFRGFMATMLSVMIGMFVGMTVSLVGIVIGRIIGYVWIKYVRGGKAGYASVSSSEEEVEADAKLPPYEEVSVVYLNEKSRPIEN